MQATRRKVPIRVYVTPNCVRVCASVCMCTCASAQRNAQEEKNDGPKRNCRQGVGGRWQQENNKPAVATTTCLTVT